MYKDEPDLFKYVTFPLVETEEDFMNNIYNNIIASAPISTSVKPRRIPHRSLSHLVHGPTSCTAPKYVFLKYLYLNNHNGYLCKIVNIAY